MNMRIIFVATILTGLAATAAVAGPDPDLGATVRGNVASQAIDIDPHYAGIPAEGSNGRRAADALIRYETGKLKPLLRTNGKTDVGAQGGAQDTPSSTVSLVGAPN